MYYDALVPIEVPRMRGGIVVVGIVLIVIGAVLLFVPVAGQGSQTVNSGSSTPFELASVSGFSITGSIPISISWTSSGPAEVVAATCSATCDTSGGVSALGGVVLQTGTSGSFTINQPNGGELVYGVVSTGGSSPVNATFTLTTALSTVGSALLIVGIVVLIIGAVLRSKSRMAAMPPAQPATPAGEPMGPTNPP